MSLSNVQSTCINQVSLVVQEQQANKPNIKKAVLGDQQQGCTLDNFHEKSKIIDRHCTPINI